MSLEEILFISWDETSRNASDCGRQLRIVRNFWKKTMGLIQPNGINSHAFKGDDVKLIYELIDELSESAGFTVRTQEHVNPLAEIHSGRIMFGKISSNMRSGYRPFEQRYHPGF